jgi:CRP-like cAMP-binding protein
MPKMRMSAYILDVLESIGEGAEVDGSGNKDFSGTSGNVLADKLPEISDFPYSLKISLLGPSSLLGEDDVIGRDTHTCSARCYSRSGKLYAIEKESFMDIIAHNNESYNAVIDNIVKKELRKTG